MELYIGGIAQGKLNYVLRKYETYSCRILEGAEMPVSEEGEEDIKILDHLHVWIKNLLSEGLPAEQIVLEYLKEHPDMIVICDEVGNGIVPILQEESEYRETVGRVLIWTAEKSEGVWRILCGLAQKLK